MFGGQDFIQYWSAYQLFRAGRNPYDPAALLAIERTQGFTGETPLMMWLPPWALSLLSPVLHWDYVTSVRLWLCCNIILMLLASFILQRVFRSTSKSAALAAAFAFAPCYAVLSLGQIGILLACAVSLLIWSLDTDKPVVAGASLALLSLKPHLFLPLLLAVCWWCFRGKRYLLLGSTIVVVCSFAAVAQLQSPGAVKHWLATFGTEQPGAISKYSWITATAVGALRQFFATENAVAPLWPIAVLPGGTLLAVASYLVLQQPKLVWHRDGPFLLCLSVFSAPFGWFFDAAVLLPAFAGMFLPALCLPPRRRVVWIAALLFFQAFTAWLYFSELHHHHQLYWFPAVMGLLWWGSRYDLPSYRP